MADVNSIQAAKIVASDYEMLRPYDHYGRRRAHYLDYVVGAVAEPDGNILLGMKIPAGARIFGGKFVQDALGAGAQVNVGLRAFDGSGFLDVAGTVADSETFLGSALDVAAAGIDTFGDTIALNYGYITEKALWVTFSVENAVWAIAGIIAAEIEIVVD